MSLEDEIAALLAAKSASADSEEEASQGCLPSTQPEPDQPSASTDFDSLFQGQSEEDAGEDASKALEEFSEKWCGRLEGQTALNLLMSPYENDFTGMIQSSSRQEADNLAHDIFKILQAQNKVEDIQVMSLNDLLRNVVDARSFGLTDDENLPINTLVILNNLDEFEPEKLTRKGKASSRFVFERLSHIVDHRYVLVVGTQFELSSFLSQDRKLRYLFDEHRIKISERIVIDPASREKALESFMDCIAPELSSRVDDEFKSKIDAFITRNERDLPFQGAELGDYLAKECNASNELTLPKGRNFESAQESLDQLVGLRAVKKTMRDIAIYATTYDRDKKDGFNPPKEKFHMVFSGPPGTGKTTVGKIAAEILYEAGVIPTSNQLTVSADKLIDPAVGGTAIKTQEVIEQAQGGVLFIDEAYSLIGPKNSNIHGADAIAQLLTAMEELDDTVIILGGYRDEMAQLIKANPGFKSRISFTLDFEAFTTEQLMEIFDKLVSDAGFELQDEARKSVLDLIAFFAPQRGFGNARFMRQAFHKAYLNRAVRFSKNGFTNVEMHIIREEDIPTRTQMLDYERWEDSQTSAEELASLIGLGDVKKKVEEFGKAMRYREIARKRGLKSPKRTMHMVFSGNPGTGKTTVARIIAKTLFECGVTATPQYKETSAQDLVGEYVGHTGAKTKDVLENAVGGVLFIDEAYSIGYNSSFGQDAIAEIVKFMEDYRDQIVIIFAGYTQEMNDFLTLNPGLASRIGYRFDFTDYDTDELQAIFELKVKEIGYSCTPEALEKSRDVFRYFHSVENFGNGRFVDKIVQAMLDHHAENLDANQIDVICADDIPDNKDVCKLISLPIHEPLGDNDDNARRIAVHEMGHAICGLELLGKTGMKLVTIEEEATGALGYVEYEKDAFPTLPTRDTLANRIAMCMGGMAAEELFMGSYSAGNSSDLEQATALATALVTKYGMSKQAGFISYPPHISKGTNTCDISSFPDEVRNAIRKILSDAFDKAKETLEQNSSIHASLADLLMKEKTISGERMVECWGAEKNATS